MTRYANCYLLVCLLALAGVLYSLQQSPAALKQIQPELSSFAQALSSPEFQKIKIQAENLLPIPLRVDDGKDGMLTQSGVIALTNAARAASSSAPLAENAKLDAAAKAKLADLFANQYFEHVSPSGKGPSDLADAAGYSYILIGENLALGNFADDNALLAAWMASPDHRANILNPRYRQIGVAVGKGTYKGGDAWIAVQEFGLQRSACPAEDDAGKQLVAREISSTGATKADLDAKKAALAKIPPDDSSYNLKAEAYNAEVKKYNAALSKLKSDTDAYNAGVEKLNACLKG